MSKKGNIWLDKQKGDRFYKKSKEQGYRARSYFKLQHIAQKYPVFSVNGRYPKKILDIGAAPGAWIEYLIEDYEKRPKDQQTTKFRIVGIDLRTIKPFKNAEYVESHRIDVFKLDCMEIIKQYSQFDVFLSDLAPKTAGDFRDIAIQHDMVRRVIEFFPYLRIHGNCIVKVFQAEESPALFLEFKQKFKNAFRMKPQASRDQSREFYFIGLDYLG